MKIFSVYILVTLLFACTNSTPKAPCLETKYSTLLKSNGKLSHSEHDSIYYLFDVGLNGRIGAYTFYKNNQLRSYSFFLDTINYSYSEQYDENGNLASIIGKPIVWAIPEGNPEYSIKVNFKLFTLNKNIISCKIKVNEKEYNNFTFIPDTTFSNMQSSHLVYYSAGKSYLNVNAELILKKCTGEILKFTDSFHLKF